MRLTAIILAVLYALSYNHTVSSLLKVTEDRLYDAYHLKHD